MITIAYIDDDNCTVSGDEIWQYDYGQKMTITGLPSLPSGEVTQVHFGTNKISGTAYAVEAEVQGSAVVVDIPDLILTSGVGEVWCFVFVCDADDGETVYRVHFPVIRRPKPNIYNEDKVYEHMFARTIAKVTQAATEASEAVEEAQEVLDSIPSDYTELSRRVLALYPTETASGDVVAFDDGADDIPVKSLSVAIEPKQSGSGDPSPSNIRPISGWDAVNVYRTGVNVWDEEWEVGGIDGSTGMNLQSSDRIRSKNYISVNPGVTYYFGYFSSEEPNFYICEYDVTKTFIKRTSMPKNRGFAVGENCYFMRFFVYAPATPITTYKNDISINYPSIDHDYHAYDGHVYPISLTSAGTVYGGTLDVTSGELTVDRAIWHITGSEAWNINADYTNRFGVNDNTKVNSGVISDNISNYLQSTTWAVSSYTFGLRSNGTLFVMLDSSSEQMTIAEFKAYLADHPLDICYKLATPTTYHLTPTEIATLLGNNTVWSDAGDIALTYRADLQKYFA